MADQSDREPDNDTDVESTGARWGSLFANAKLGRLISVVLFVLAGSAAVVYSMRARPPVEAATEAASEEAGESTTPPTEADGQPAPQLSSGEIGTAPAAEDGQPTDPAATEDNPYLPTSAGLLGAGLASLNASAGNALSPAVATPANALPIMDSPVVQAAAPIPTPTISTGDDTGFSPAAPPSTPGPAADRFAGLKMPGRPASPETEESSAPDSTRRPPGDRFAQLPGQPLIGSRNGFGQREPAGGESAEETLPGNGPLSAAKPLAAEPSPSSPLSRNELRGGSFAALPESPAEVPEPTPETLPALATQNGSQALDSPFTAPSGNLPRQPLTTPTFQAQEPADDPDSVAQQQPAEDSGFMAPPFTPPQAGTTNPTPPSPASAFPALPQPLPKQAEPATTAGGFAGLPSSSPTEPARAEAFPSPPATEPSTAPPAAASDFSSAAPAMREEPGNGRIQSKASLPAAPSQPVPATQISAASANPMTGSAGTTTAAPKAALDVPGDRRLDGVQSPQLTIQKISPPEVQVNQPADFQIVIKNVGASAVDQVQVHDRIPSGTRFDGANPQPADQSQGTLVWSLGTILPGQEKRISMRLTPQRPGEIGSVAQLTFASRSSMRTRVTQPVLEISHRARPSVLVGDPVVFDVVVSNKGDGPARDVLIQEEIPAQLAFANGFREIEYEIGTLSPGQSRSVRLQLTAKEAGKLKNVMIASAAGGLKAEHEIDMEVVAPQLKLAAEGPTRRFLGRTATHALTLNNPGTAPATNVELIARLPRGLRYVSSNNRGVYDPNNHAVFWSLAQLATSQQAQVELTTTPTEVGQQPIVFETVADLELREKVTQELEVEHLVDVFFDIDDVVDPIEIGSKTQYRVELVNQGTKVATDVRVVVDFPAGLQPTEASGSLPFTVQGRQIVFQPITSMRPGEKVNLSLTATGQAAGDHRVIVKVQTADRSTPVSKEESTHVYSDH